MRTYIGVWGRREGEGVAYAKGVSCAEGHLSYSSCLFYQSRPLANKNLVGARVLCDAAGFSYLQEASVSAFNTCFLHP